MANIITNILKKKRDFDYSLQQKARNEAIVIRIKQRIHPHIDKKMSQEQIKEAVNFYKPYFKLNPLFHNYYYSVTGEFHKEYIPDDIYVKVIDTYFNNLKKAAVLENKTYFPRMFPEISQPYPVAFRINGIWLSNDYHILDSKQLNKILLSEKNIVIKQADGSSGGKDVVFIEFDSSAEKFLKEFYESVNKIKKQRDIIVQRAIVQHKELAKLNESSVNSIRVLSLLKDNEVKIYSVIVRMGVSGARVDNASSGGIFCGVCENGILKSVAYNTKGDRFNCHPNSGLHFETVTVPSFDKIIYLVKRAALMIPDIRMVSWDISVTEDGVPVLIEANMGHGELDFHQMCNGPLFGGDTEKIMREVYND